MLCHTVLPFNGNGTFISLNVATYVFRMLASANLYARAFLLTFRQRSRNRSPVLQHGYFGGGRGEWAVGCSVDQFVKTVWTSDAPAADLMSLCRCCTRHRFGLSRHGTSSSKQTCLRCPALSTAGRCLDETRRAKPSRVGTGRMNENCFDRMERMAWK